MENIRKINKNDKLFWLMLMMAVTVTHVEAQVQASPPCFFIFGDSLSDSGNNNPLATVAKFNYLPYGVDFPSGPTGRPTNGRTVPDFLSEFLGLPFIPPFANTRNSDILKGVNYASSGAGILVETGKHLGTVLSIDRQLTNHRTTIGTISAKLGGDAAAQAYLNKCLYYVNIGSNDYLNNYFMPLLYPSSSLYNLNQFADLLISNYSRQIRALHNSGGRKFALVSLLFGACSPAMGKNVCPDIGDAGGIFNRKLRAMVDQLNSEFSADSSFIFVDSTSIITLNPAFRGLNAIGSCCETAPTGSCAPISVPCLNGNDYVFWDGFHPTQVVNSIIAHSAFNSSNPAFTYPKNIANLLS